MGVGKLLGRLCGCELHRVGVVGAVWEGGEDERGAAQPGGGVRGGLDGRFTGGFVDVEGPAVRQLAVGSELGALRPLTRGCGGASLIRRGGDVRVSHLGLLALPLAVLGHLERDCLGGVGGIRVGHFHGDVEGETGLDRRFRGDGDVAVGCYLDVDVVAEVAQQVFTQLERGAGRDVTGARGGLRSARVAIQLSGIWPGGGVLCGVALSVRGGVAVLVRNRDLQVGVRNGSVRVGHLDPCGCRGACAHLGTRGYGDVALVIHRHVELLRGEYNGEHRALRQRLCLVGGNLALALLDRQRIVGNCVVGGLVVAAFHNVDGGLVLASLLVLLRLSVEFVHLDGEFDAAAGLRVKRRLDGDLTCLLVSGEGVAQAVGRADKAVRIRIGSGLRRRDLRLTTCGDVLFWPGEALYCRAVCRCRGDRSERLHVVLGVGGWHGQPSADQGSGGGQGDDMLIQLHYCVLSGFSGWFQPSVRRCAQIVSPTKPSQNHLKPSPDLAGPTQVHIACNICKRWVVGG